MGKVLKKASKCLYFLVQLKRAKLSSNDLVLLYTTSIRSILLYTVPGFFLLRAAQIFAEWSRTCTEKSTFDYISWSCLHVRH